MSTADLWWKCRACGYYELKATTPECPECGKVAWTIVGPFGLNLQCLTTEDVA